MTKANRLDNEDLIRELDRHLDMFCIAHGVRIEARDDGVVAIVHDGREDMRWNNLRFTEER